MSTRLLVAAIDAYIALLRLPPSQRIQVQSELCALRDAIAEEMGKDPEDVQVRYEAVAQR